MKRYLALLKHDQGLIWIMLYATDFATALQLILSIERCPASAVTSLTEVLP